MNWVIAIVVLVVVGFILDREIYFYEGAHLGPRLQSWLYDRWSRKYDAGKRESQRHDDEMLAQPLLERLKDIPEPFLLDFATGTGRLSFALIRRPEFDGRIIALDISQRMLEQATKKLTSASMARPLQERVEFLRYQSMPLPFPDATFDAVCCLEVLELLPDAQAALREMNRLLRPGGVLLTSRGTEESGRRDKVTGTVVFTSMLEASGFENVQITKWWKLFDRVFANKTGSSPAVGAKTLIDILNCSSCGQIDWQRTTDTLLCKSCGKQNPITREGIVLK